MSKARQARDWKDTLAVVLYLQERNPFSNDPSLRNIATGVHAHPTLNVDTAHTVGSAILKSMEGKTIDEHTFGRNDPVVTLGTKSSIKIDGEEVQVDPQLLFKRLIIVAQTSMPSPTHLSQYLQQHTRHNTITNTPIVIPSPTHPS